MKHLIILLIFIPSLIFSQGWEKTYGGDENDNGKSVQQTSDGGYIISGSTGSFGNGSSDVYLIKTDNKGETLWSKTFGGLYSDLGYSVQQTTDGGYIITGKTDLLGNYRSYLYLIKTDSNGNTLWTKSFGGENSLFGYSVQQTNDGGYIITGYTFYHIGNGDYDVYLIKTDSNGDSLWSKTYGGADWDIGLSVQQTNDDGYIITGFTYSYGIHYYYNSEVYLIRTDNNGDTLWTKTYGSVFHDIGHSVHQTIDSGYIITGSVQPNGGGRPHVYLIKTDSNGDTLWTKTYQRESDCWGVSVQQTMDSGYILVGSTFNFGSENGDVYLIKTDPNGDTLWTKTFGGEGNDSGYSVQQTSDGGYIITGSANSYGSSYDVYLIKTDENGIITFTSEIPVPNPNKKLIRTIDISGKEITNPRTNQLYIEIYDDGTTQKKMKLK